MNKGRKKVYIVISIVLLIVICCGIYKYRTTKYDSSKKGEVNMTKSDGKTAQESGSKENEKKYGKSTYTDAENTAKSKTAVSSGSQKNITVEQAVKTVSECYENKNESTKFVYDHEVTRDNTAYYVIQVFDSMEDHSATSNWYYIDKKDGKAYKWDLNQDKLIPVN